MLVCTKALHIRHIFYNFMYVCGGVLTMYHGWVLICNQHLHVLLMAYPYMMSELVPTFALLLSVQYCHFSTTIYAAKYSQYYCKHVFHCLYSVYLSSRPTNSLSWDMMCWYSGTVEMLKTLLILCLPPQALLLGLKRITKSWFQDGKLTVLKNPKVWNIVVWCAFAFLEIVLLTCNQVVLWQEIQHV